MKQYILLRLMQLIPVLLLTSVAVFMLIRVIPGDPAHIIAGAEATPEQLEAVRNQLGLDQPLPVQYVIWLGRVLRGDLGKSVISDLPVTRIIALSSPRSPAPQPLARAPPAVPACSRAASTAARPPPHPPDA